MKALVIGCGRVGSTIALNLHEEGWDVVVVDENEDALSRLGESWPGTFVVGHGMDTAVLREAGIPLREGLHQGNHPAWDGAVSRPDLGLYEQWALAFSGDTVATAIMRAEKSGRHYDLKKRIIVKGAPVVEIYQRQPPPTQ